MARITDYASLVDNISEWMDRADLSGQVDNLIQLCEARLRRELNPLFAETAATVTTSAGYGALPADCDVIRLVTYDGGELQQVSPVHGRQFPESDAPRGFSLEAAGIRIWPSNDVTVTVLYKPKLTAITSGNTTGALLTQHPDLYLFGSLMFAEGFTQNDARAAQFEMLWTGALEEVKAFLARQRRVSTRLRSPAVIA